MVPSIISELEAIAPELVRQVEEARVRAEEQHHLRQEEMRQHKLEVERFQRAKNRQDSRRDLLAAIAAFDEARRVADCFKSIESELERLPEADSALVRERLRLAKELVGTLHPLALLKHWKAPDER
jgi:hypothetical protein